MRSSSPQCAAPDLPCLPDARHQWRDTNVVLLEPDVAKVFWDSATVNETLRQYLSEHGAPQV